MSKAANDLRVHVDSLERQYPGSTETAAFYAVFHQVEVMERAYERLQAEHESLKHELARAYEMLNPKGQS